MDETTVKVAAVTGASRGIGLAVAKSLVTQGWQVALGARSNDEVQAAAGALDDAGPGAAVGFPLDVRDRDSCAAFIREVVGHYGRLDLLVNNAGLGIMAPVQEMRPEDWDAQIDTNLTGVFNCSQAAIPDLIASGDSWIVNIGSLAGKNPFPEGCAYNASKFGLVGLSEAMMLDLRHHGVRVTLIMPGSVDTHFRGRIPGSGSGWRLQPDDVARLVMDLVSHPSRSLPSRVEIRPTRPPQR